MEGFRWPFPWDWNVLTLAGAGDLAGGIAFSTVVEIVLGFQPCLQSVEFQWVVPYLVTGEVESVAHFKWVLLFLACLLSV